MRLDRYWAAEKKLIKSSGQPRAFYQEKLAKLQSLTGKEIQRAFREDSAADSIDPQGDSPNPILSEDDQDTLLGVADFFASKSRYAEAIPYYKEALTLDPENKNILFSLLNCFLITDQYEELFFYSNFLKAHYPKDPEVCSQLLVIYQAVAEDYTLKGYLPEAIALYKGAFDFVREDKKARASIFLALAEIYFATADLELAHDCYGFALESNPHCERSKSQLEALKMADDDQPDPAEKVENIIIFSTLLFAQNTGRGGINESTNKTKVYHNDFEALARAPAVGFVWDTSRYEGDSGDSPVAPFSEVLPEVAKMLWQLTTDPTDTVLCDQYLELRAKIHPGTSNSNSFLGGLRQTPTKKPGNDWLN